MERPAGWFLILALAVSAASQVHAAKIESVWMTGRSAAEADPLLVDMDGHGQHRILALNRTGQVFLWDTTFQAETPEPTKPLVQLPPGPWSASPAVVDTSSGKVFIACSQQGLVLALNRDFQTLWEYNLPAPTPYDRNTPAVVHSNGKHRICIGDDSGTVTCLDIEGKVLWARKLSDEACDAAPNWFDLGGRQRFLVPAGSALCCLSVEGDEIWRRDLGGDIQSKPETLLLEDRMLILCGAGEGSLFALSPEGEVNWSVEIGDVVANSIAFLPRGGSAPWILCSGLWGNLFAFDINGKPVWSNLYRAKGRGAPLVLDADGDGKYEIYRGTYAHRLYVFDDTGSLLDDVRFNAIVHATPLAIPEADGRSDVLVCTNSFLALRLSSERSASPYPMPGKTAEISLSSIPPDSDSGVWSIHCKNPVGERLNIEITGESPDQGLIKQGFLTVRSEFEAPIPSLLQGVKQSITVSVRDVSGAVRARHEWVPEMEPIPAEYLSHVTAFRAWSTPAYGAFSPARTTPCGKEILPSSREVNINDLYLGEADQGAFIIASATAQPLRVRVSLSMPTNEKGEPFGGNITLREVVLTGTVSGQEVPDALPVLQPGGLIQVPALQSTKVWLSVDAGDTVPGIYRGKIGVTPLKKGVPPAELDLVVQVLDLNMPDRFPLSVCTWDGIPNHWFKTQLDQVFEDMDDHGVNVFPHSQAVPKAKADSVGNLEVDWSNLDRELERLPAGSLIFLPFPRPPIAFADGFPEAEKRRVEIQYIRKLRDHLQSYGWGYERFALYPVDEPGHDEGKLVETQVESGKLFREADPKIRIYTDPVWTLPWEDFSRCLPYVDLWAPNIRFVNGLLCGDPRMKHLRETGKPMWSYECCSQVKSVSPLRYPRGYSWRARFFGLEGIGIWTHSETQVDHWFGGKGINDEYALVYPGELPVPSARWEGLRDGLEDISALAMLENTVKESLAKRGDSPEVDEAREVLRLAMNDMMDLSDTASIESRDYLRQGDRLIWHSWSDEALVRHHRAEIARMTLALRN